MKKKDLKCWMRVKLRSGEMFIVDPKDYYMFSKDNYIIYKYNDNFEFNNCGKLPKNDIMEIYEPPIDAKYRLDPNRVGNLVWARNNFYFEHNGTIYSEYELHNILNGIKK